MLKTITDQDAARLPKRRWILEYPNKHGIGAELGVFCGHFSEWICEICAPEKLFLVDEWWSKFGDYYPDWGEYTHNGNLRTRTAFEEAKCRVGSFNSVKTEFIVGQIEDFLIDQNDLSFDFFYLDAGHSFEETLVQLQLCAQKLKPGGWILGDDWHHLPGTRFHGVYRAVQEFVNNSLFEVVAAGPGFQFALRQSNYD